ncbi:MAG: DUF927 domain-containing protein, partial [Planctomycetales bacterium]
MRGFRCERLVDTARAQLVADAATDQAEDEGESAPAVRLILPEAPAAEGTVVPPGWELSAAGVSRTGSESPAATSPIIITRRLVDVREGVESLELAWFRDGEWRTFIFSRAKLAATRAIVEIADFGLPVNSNNAAELVAYLADYEAVNIEALPVERISRTMGWQGDHEEVFLWGRSLITHAEARPVASVAFRGADIGEDQLADGYHANGTFEEWSAGLASLIDFQRVRLSVYASLCTPLLAVVNGSNYILSYAGATSQGKTTTLQIAASPWGQPIKGGGEPSVVAGWDSTRVYIERTAAVLRDLPLILDDTKEARHPEDISLTIYGVANGRGRGRGSPDGLRETASFRTVMLSSGEDPITSFTRDGGTRARALELWGSPFGAADARIGGIITALTETITHNYGHAGPRFVHFLTANRDQWAGWRRRHQELRHEYAERAGDNSVASRMAIHFALLSLTVVLTAEANVVPWPADGLVADLWETITAHTHEADQAAAALQHVWSWVRSNSRRFQGRCLSGEAPFSGWAGCWEGTPDGWSHLYLFPHVLAEILSEGGFDSDSTKRMWADRGWLRQSPGRGTHYRCRFDGQLANMVAVTREAIREVLGEDEIMEETDEPRPPRQVHRPGD